METVLSLAAVAVALGLFWFFVKDRDAVPPPPPPPPANPPRGGGDISEN